MNEYELKLKAVDDAAYDLLRLSSAYDGTVGTLLYVAAADVGDRMKRLRRELQSATALNVVYPTCDGTTEVHSHNPQCPTCAGKGKVSYEVAKNAPRS